MPVNFGVGKINTLFVALCKLHNFCIKERINDGATTAIHMADEANVAQQQRRYWESDPSLVNYDASIARLPTSADEGNVSPEAA